ncbi:MAG: S8 family serine peptidase [Brevefilum sp.]|nr:S8 family serine peptidase [Anaerolineae bacterium]MDT8381861.1 S8 family serine peptidase [Brevefilum sp.]
MNRRMYFHKRWFLKPALLGMIFILLIGGTYQTNAQSPVSQTDPPFTTIALPEDDLGWVTDFSSQEIKADKDPKLDTVLSQLAAAGDSASRELIIESQSLKISDGRVQVQISTSPDDLSGAIEAIELSGALATKTSNDGTLIQAWLPVEVLQKIAEIDQIHYIRRPDQMLPVEELNAGSLTTEGLTAINGSAWHTAGFQGAGVKVGIMDVGFQGYTSLLGEDLPASVIAKNFVDGETDPQVDGTTKHGTACAEINYDIAPGASLYIAKVGTLLDMEEAVTWLRDVHHVDIISTSLVLYNVSPGDGTGFLEDLVSDARDAGITWITAAGNDREVHWGSAYYDSNADGTHDFSGAMNVDYFGPGDGTGYSIPTGYPITIHLRWDDWTAVDQDYDLYLLRWTGSSWTAVAASQNDQNGGAGQRPTESIVFVTTAEASAYGFAIARYNSTRNVHLEVSTPNMLHLQYYVYDRSLANLADAGSAITVAALDVNSPYPQEPYSSQGPTNGFGGTESGGFIKPDIAGFANVSTVSYGTTDKFNGTSCATPHVAGAAALALNAYPTYTPDQLQSFLEGRAVDMGTGGMDNIYGYGRLHLGDPPLIVTSPIVTSINPNTGEDTGSIAVTISGSNFEVGATVKLTKTGQTDINGSGVTVPNSNQINCTFNLTGAAAGTWNVVVTNPDTQSGTLTNGFTVTSPTIPAPIVTSINPNTAENTASIPVSITGNNFIMGATVKLTKSGHPNINATSVNVSNATQIFCNLNLIGAASGQWNVVVTNPDTQSGTLTNGFTVTSITPTEWMSYLPLIVKPLNPPTLNEISNTDGDGSYTVSWSSSSGATSYTLQEDENAAFSSPTTVYEGSSTSKAISGRDVGTYYYRVKATTGSMSSGWSNIRSVVVTVGLPEYLAFQIGESNAYYYVYSSGRSFNSTSPMDYPVTQVQTISYLASTQPVTFYISLKHNGTTVASWSISVNHSDFREYIRTTDVSFQINAGDTLTYYISSNTYNPYAAVHGVSKAVFYK